MQGHDFFVGIDWGYELHQACLIDGQGETVAERKFEHGKGLNDLSRWLQEQMGDGLLAVAIETPHGPVVETMMERGLAVYSVNPGQLDRFRDRLSPSGARDDRRDARVLAISLRSDPHCFRKLKAHPAALAELRELNRIEIGLTENRGSSRQSDSSGIMETLSPVHRTRCGFVKNLAGRIAGQGPNSREGSKAP